MISRRSASLGTPAEVRCPRGHAAPLALAGEVMEFDYPPALARSQWEQRFRAAYCSQMTAAAESLEAKAVVALSSCLSQSTELSWFNEWSSLCALALNQIKPGEYPLDSEIRVEPGYAGVTLDVAPPGQIVTEEYAQDCW